MVDKVRRAWPVGTLMDERFSHARLYSAFVDTNADALEGMFDVYVAGFALAHDMQEHGIFPKDVYSDMPGEWNQSMMPSEAVMLTIPDGCRLAGEIAVSKASVRQAEAIAAMKAQDRPQFPIESGGAVIYDPNSPLTIISEVLDGCLALLKAKNNDYAGPTDFFKNLSLCERNGVCSTEQGILVRMSDKYSRLCTLMGAADTESQVKNESIEDTLKDLLNYSVLLIAYRRTKRVK